MHDGKHTVRLTDNDVHDVAPHVRGGYIMWQTQFAEGWRVAMYDIDSGVTEYIGSGDGAKVENPRFVLVYDSLSENGDIKTVGYDLDTKETISLSRIPTSLPKEIPEPESTGETRALIQNKSTARENEVVDSVPTVKSGGTGTTRRVC